VLELVAEARIGNTRATSLLITESSPRQIVVSGLDGIVVGYWVIPRENAPEERPVDLHLYWAYRAEQAVQTLQHLHPMTKAGASPELPLIVAGSYDEHLHVLDVFGRHLEIVYLPKMKIDRFVTGLALGGDSDLTEGRVYACAFENQFRVLRVISRRRLLAGMDKELWALGEDEREERLSRWRAYSLKEGHLRHRFARQSRRYPGPRVQDALTEIHSLLEAGDNSDRTTGLVTALLRRLFQNHLPGRTSREEEPLRGLREVLTERSLYLGVIRLVRQLEEQWNTPGSLENRRVQLFWIRSFLRNIEDVAMLRRWVALGAEVSTEEPLAAADELLYHFLENLTDLLQLKTLQYVERLLIGWSGIDESGLLKRGESIEPADLDWLLNALLRWLRTHRSLIHMDRPHPVVLQIGRLFGSLIHEGHLDPLYLSHRLQNEDVRGEMDKILIGQCAAMASLPTSESWSREKVDWMTQAALMLAKSRQLEIQLDPPHPVAALVATMEEILAHTQQSSSSSVFLKDVGLYFRNLIPLLQVQNLEDLKNLAQSWKPEPGPCSSFSSYEELKGLTLVLDQIARYWDKKYADIYANPMRCLQYEDFHAIRTAWRLVKESFQENRSKFLRQEQRIFSRVINQWEQIILEEQNKYLLRDLFQIVEGFLGEIPKASMNAVEAMARVAAEEELTFTAFSNLFTRLLLFSEPTRALFIYRGVETRTVGSRVFAQSEDPDRYDLIEGNLQGRPFEIPPEWTTWEEFERLEVQKILDWLTNGEPTLTWRVVPIPIASEAASHFGFYVFGWRDASANGLERFEMHQLTWVLLLQALSFRQASVSQDAMKGRMFSIVAHNLAAPVFKMRSDLGVLLNGFFEDQPTQRKEKYLELLRQARHMTGIIDGILSLSSRETSVAFDNVSLASVIYEVVRTLRKDARAKRIDIVFEKPDHDDEIASLFWTDEVMIYDILLNLIGNAIKYSPARSQINVDLQMQRKGAEIKVRDEGPGIPRNELPLVFDPFFRGSIPTVQGIQGLGLGLYVSQLYTKKLSGRISVANNSDKGVTFTVYLPRQTGRDHEGG
jgi:signal transduction histidine kinase